MERGMPDYGTVMGFKTYHTARGRAVIIAAFDDDEIEPAKLVASEWLDANYRSSFPGLKTGGRDQVREWPRVGGIDIYGYGISGAIVPTEVENATYELTLIDLQAPGTLTKSYTPSKYESVSVDGAISVRYRSGVTVADMQTQYKIVADILAPLLCSGVSNGLSGSVVRV